MESSCFNCGKTGHFYFECNAKDSVVGKFKKKSTQDFLKSHPEVNRKRLGRQVERRKLKEEGHTFSYALINDGMERKLDELLEIKAMIDDNKIKIYIFQKIINEGLYRRLKERVDSILGDIRALTCFAVSYLKYNKSLHFYDQNLLWGKQMDLHDARDIAVGTINAALSCIEKYYEFMKNRIDGDPLDNPREENQVDLKMFAATLSQISVHVEIIGAEKNSYWDPGNGNNVDGIDFEML